jgi:hypothetical protein
MKPSPDDPDRAPLAGYADGDPDAVRAARPHEPSEEEWDAVLRRVQSRLAEPVREPPHRRVGVWLAAATLAAAAAAVAWVAVALDAPRPDPRVREVADVRPTPAAEVSVAPLPHEPAPDPLAEFPVLPVATAVDVVLYRVPGAGMLPVGEHPLPGELALATPEDVELEDPNPAWPSVMPAPGYAPMIFAAKPR